MANKGILALITKYLCKQYISTNIDWNMSIQDDIPVLKNRI